MFQVGQMVKCHRSLAPEHDKLVGCIGTVEQVFGFLEIMMYGGNYGVNFPGHNTAFCEQCREDHDALQVMLAPELRPVDDPDQGNEILRTRGLPEIPVGVT